MVALLDGPPRLLRPGAVTRAEIEALIGPLAEAEADATRSPGRLTRHYAPNAPLRLDADGAARRRGLPGLRARAGGTAALQPQPDAATCAEAAANLFAYLRAADRLGADGHRRRADPRRRASARRSTTACAAPRGLWAERLERRWPCAEQMQV